MFKSLILFHRRLLVLIAVFAAVLVVLVAQVGRLTIFQGRAYALLVPLRSSPPGTRDGRYGAASGARHVHHGRLPGEAIRFACHRAPGAAPWAELRRSNEHDSGLGYQGTCRTAGAAYHCVNVQSFVDLGALIYGAGSWSAQKW